MSESVESFSRLPEFRKLLVFKLADEQAATAKAA